MKEIATALNKAQAVMGGAKKDKNNPFFKSKYADLASVFEAIREPFADNGLSITQPMEVLENGRTVLKTKLLHISGEMIESSMLLPEIADCQKLGSAITYLRRYSLMAIAGISPEDDDGNAAVKGIKETSNNLSAAQVSFVKTAANGDAILIANILEAYGVDRVSNIPANCFPDLKMRLENTLKERKAS